jgi:hypothetical protein
MQLRLTYPRLATVGVAIVSVGLSLTGVAYAITSSVFRYSTAKVGYHTIHPMDLAADNDSRTYTILYLEGTLNSPSGGCFQTALHLPERANITGMSVWSSETAGGNVTAQIFRTTLSNGDGLLVANEPSTDTSGTRVGKFYPITSPATVISRNYGYGFDVCLAGGAASTFYGARIQYSFTDAGD